MGKLAKISVIVPVYNAAKTLNACVSSILSQTLSELEVILIDDGSTDNSFPLMEQLLITDSRIRLFKKANGGQSSARNMGLDNATGDYIAFVDSDDTIDTDMLSLLYQNAVETVSALSICGVRLLQNGIDIAPKKHDESRIVFTKIEAVTMLLSERYILFSVCDKLYRRDLFETIRFEEGVIHEDILLPYQVTLLCEHIVCEMKPKYNYLLNTQSTTGKAFSPARLYDIIAREKLCDDVARRFPALIENAKSTRLTGYLNLANKLVFAEVSSKKQYLPPIISSVKKNAVSYLKCPYINKKKKLGVLLLCLGAPFYKAVYKARGGTG